MVAVDVLLMFRNSDMSEIERGKYYVRLNEDETPLYVPFVQIQRYITQISMLVPKWQWTRIPNITQFVHKYHTAETRQNQNFENDYAWNVGHYNILSNDEQAKWVRVYYIIETIYKFQYTSSTMHPWQ